MGERPLPEEAVQVTCFDPFTGERETQTLPEDSYIIVCGDRCEITSIQRYANGTTQLTLKTLPRVSDCEQP